MLLVGGGGYLYYTGFLAKDPAKVQMTLDAELKAQGLDDIHVEVSKDRVVTVSGFVENEADKGRALGIVESDKDVKDIENRITVATAKASPARGTTESPNAQPPSMRKVEELIKQGTFE
ncbi:MAG: BON domain-containing protein [candidate division NC10 bacterium]|nr:BON domain-containing protein [candidate division NC10 bacterium]MDE2322985.1 BON domain-containing protein [candidate division NC10 bacterium]